MIVVCLVPLFVNSTPKNMPQISPLISTVLIGIVSMMPVLALEPLVDSSESFLQKQVRSQMSRLDKDKDGKIGKAEEEKFWRRNARHDTNKDGGLDAEELLSIPIASIDSPGRKLLNVVFKRVEKKDVSLDFYFPDEDTSSEKPVVVFTHGGGWAAGDKSKAGFGSFNTVHRALLKEGFCVLSVGYRKVNKFGDTAMRDCVIDCKDAVRFVSAHHKELGIDPNQIFPFGDSAGGQLAQMLLFTTPESLTGDSELAKFSYRTVAGVSWYGPCDFQDIQLFNYDDDPNFKDRFGGRIMGSDTGPQGKEERYREMSPVSYLTEKSPPLLMLQGDKDTTIPVKQAYRMEKALKTIKAPVKIEIVKNAGHNWRKVGAPIDPSREEIIAQTIAFIREHANK